MESEGGMAGVDMMRDMVGNLFVVGGGGEDPQWEADGQMRRWMVITCDYRVSINLCPLGCRL